MDKSMVKYLHYGASLAGVVLLGVGLLSLLVLGLMAPMVIEQLGDTNLPGLSQVMFSRIPSYLGVVAGAALSAMCFARRTKLSVTAVILSWLFSCLLLLMTVLSVMVPMMKAQAELR